MDATDKLLDAINRLERDVKDGQREVREGFERVNKRLDHTDADYKLLKGEFEHLRNKVEVIDGDLKRAKDKETEYRKSVSERFDAEKGAIDGMQRHMDARFSKLEEDGKARANTVANVAERIGKVDDRVERVEAQVGFVVSALTPDAHDGSDAPPTKFDAVTKGQQRSTKVGIAACVFLVLQIALELLRQFH